jgi:hypothetical protein
VLDVSVFINYRRDSTGGEAGRLSDRLKEAFGEKNVYFDVEEPAGIEWLKEIERRGSSATVVLVLIGRDWVEQIRARATPGLRGHTDYVRREIEWALTEWSGRIIPVLVDTSFPEKYTLPRSLRRICDLNASVPLRQTSWKSDVAALIEEIRNPPSPAPEPAPESEMAEGGAARPLAQPPVEVPRPAPHHFERIAAATAQGRVVVFLGPSVRGALPDAALLAERLGKPYGFSGDLAEVAQRVRLTEGEEELYASIREILAAASKPTPVHRFLAGLPRLLRGSGHEPAPQLIISTNYDWALERAFEETGVPFDYAVYMVSSGRFLHLPWGEREGEPRAVTIDVPGEYRGFPISEDVERTVIVKIHGSIEGEDPLAAGRNNYLLTEDHYMDFLPSQNIHDHVPVQILGKLMRSRCLFLGYTLRDWNARLLLRRIWHGTQLLERSWAVLTAPDDLELVTWRTIGNVELLWAHPSDFLNDLGAVLAQRDPPVA